MADSLKSLLGPLFSEWEVAPRIYRYSDEADFKSLWVERKPAPAIVVWDGYPQSIDERFTLLQRFVSPLDLALGRGLEASISTEGGENTHVWPMIVIDLYSHNIAGSFSCDLAQSLVAVLPHVTYLSAFAQPSAGGGLGNFLELTAFSRKPAPLPSPYGPEHAPSLRAMRMTWAGYAESHGDHHDLNNLIAPYLLDATAGSLKHDPLGWALFRMLCMSGMASAEPVEGRSTAPQVGSSKACEDEPLNVLLIDDQIENGWGSLLTQSLFGSAEVDFEGVATGIRCIAADGNLRLYGSASPWCLLEALRIKTDKNLEALDVDVDAYAQRIYDSPLPSDRADSTPWVLFLDLHLFAHDRDAEHKWVQMLARVALRLVEVQKLAWQGFSEQAALGEIATGKGCPASYEGLTLSLFPRICALRWPTVPIVLFSGTQRRDLLERLSHYGNIRLAVAKPNALRGEIRAQLDSFCFYLRESLRSSLRLARLNGLLTLANSHRTLVRSRLPRVECAEAHEGTQSIHVECYLDESGSYGSEASQAQEEAPEASDDGGGPPAERAGNEPSLRPFCLSAVVAIYDSESSAEAWNAEISQSAFDLPIGPAGNLRMSTTWCAAAGETVSAMPKHEAEVFELARKRILSTRAQPDAGLASSCALTILRALNRGLGDPKGLSRATLSQVPACECADEHLQKVEGQTLELLLEQRVIARTKFRLDSDRLTFSCSLSCKHKKSTEWSVPEAYLLQLFSGIGPDLVRRLREGWTRAVSKSLAAGTGERRPSLFCLHAEILGAPLTASSSFGDGLYDEVISLISEALCFDVVPELLGRRVASHRMFYATRLSKRLSKDELVENFYRWGALPNYGTDIESRDGIFHAQVGIRDEVYDKLRRVLAMPYVDREKGVLVGETLANITRGNWNSIVTRTSGFTPPADIELTRRTVPSPSDVLPRKLVTKPAAFLAGGKSEFISPPSPGMLVRAAYFRRATNIVSGGGRAPQLLGAGAFKLNSDVLPRHIHSLADWAPRIYKEARLQEMPLVAWHVAGRYETEDTRAYRMLMDACADSDANNNLGAVSKVIDAMSMFSRISMSAGWKCPTRLSVLDILGSRASRCISLLSGAELQALSASNQDTVMGCSRVFHGLCERLEREPELPGDLTESLEVISCSTAATQRSFTATVTHESLPAQSPPSRGSPNGQFAHESADTVGLPENSVAQVGTPESSGGIMVETTIQPEPATAYPHWFVLGGFRSIDLGVSRDKRQAVFGIVEQLTCAALKQAGFESTQFVARARLNAKLTGVVCDVGCDTRVAAWLLECGASDDLPWGTRPVERMTSNKWPLSAIGKARE